jgi:hypothetical protein
MPLLVIVLLLWKQECRVVSPLLRLNPGLECTSAGPSSMTCRLGNLAFFKMGMPNLAHTGMAVAQPALDVPFGISIVRVRTHTNHCQWTALSARGIDHHGEWKRCGEIDCSIATATTVVPSVVADYEELVEKHLFSSSGPASPTPHLA